MSLSLYQVAAKASSKVNEFILEWKTPQYYNKTLILVEGCSDKLFYYKFFDESTAEVRDCGGCGTLIEVHKILKENASVIKSHISIKDSDFDRLNNALDKDIFYADGHDYEMMCMKNPDVRKNLFLNLAVSYEEGVIDSVFQALRKLSYFKWYNYTHHNNYIVKNIPVDDSICLDDFNSIHRYSYTGSIGQVLIEENAFNTFMDDHAKCDKYEITNGHDFLNRLCCHIKKYKPRCRNINEEKVKTTIHACFDQQEFKETKLYLSIKRWELSEGKVILRR